MKILLILSILSNITFASEGDAFSARLFSDYKEMGPQLSAEVNRRLEKAIKHANTSEVLCDKNIVLKSIENEMLRPVVGVVEFWSSHSDEVSGHYIKYADSIYKEIPLKENLPVHLGKLGMATFFSINGTLVASDKFGHFFDEGHTYFNMINKEGKTLEQALQRGVDLENGSYGLKRSKVFSYGDLVANRNGLDFWTNLLANPNGKNMLSCENGKWAMSYQFDWKDYVDDGWDEGINCNGYADRTTVDRVNDVIKRLEEKSGRHLTCPAEKEKCAAVIKKYQGETSYLVSPSCF